MLSIEGKTSAKWSKTQTGNQQIETACLYIFKAKFSINVAAHLKRILRRHQFNGGSNHTQPCTIPEHTVNYFTCLCLRLKRTKAYSEEGEKKNTSNNLVDFF